MKINVLNGKNSIVLDSKKETNLLNLLLQNDISVDAQCGGNKKCGKCKVRVIQGNFIYNSEELKFLSEREVKENIILACFHRAYEVSEVEILNKDTFNMEVLHNYSESKIDSSKYEVVEMSGLNENLSDNRSITQMIDDMAGENYRYSLNSLREIGNIKEPNKLSILLENGSKVISVSDAREKIEGYGISVDIGATTIAIVLVDLINKNVIDKRLFINPQVKFGGDVVSRINYNNTFNDNVLSSLLLGKIGESIEDIVTRNHIKKDRLYHITIAGNTTMIYFFLRIDPYKLSLSPFTTVDLNTQEFKYFEIFDNSFLDSTVTVLPGISAYVGADIVSGIYQCDLHNLEENILFIDIGTNGEIALKTTNGDLICAATAAGPAFEGANIKDGIGSIPGAISKVVVDGENFIYETIGKEKPVGICGSGLVDIVAESLKKGFIDETGRMEGYDKLVIHSKENEISLYPEDVRNLQLAKSAIAAGVDVLLDEAELKIDALDKVYIAGGFGNNVNIANAMKIGLIPKIDAGKIKLVGNTSLGGCVKYLFDSAGKNSLKEIRKSTRYLELSSDQRFNEAYIDNIFFKEFK